MVSLIDVLIGMLALASAAIMLRNIIVRGDVRFPLKIEDRGGLVTVIDGEVHRGVVFVSEGIPRADERVSMRLAELSRSMRINASFITTMIKVRRGRLLSLLEEEMKRTELALNTTKHIKYQERLRLLNNIYKIVARTHTPYISSVAVVIWLPEGEESKSTADAFRTLLEAELGVKFRRVDAVSLSKIVSLIPESIVVDKGHVVVVGDEVNRDPEGVVVGVRVDSDQVATIDWPRAFEAHVGVFGPTGKGKTVLLSGIASQLSIMSSTRRDPVMVAVIDPKGDLASLLRRIADSYYSVNPDWCVKMPRLDGIAQLLIKSSAETGLNLARVDVCRGSLVERGLVVYDLSGLGNEVRNMAGSLILASLAMEASEGGLPGRVVAIIDEAWRNARGEALHLSLAFREGRSRGLYIVYATQSPSDVPKDILDNTSTVIVFGGYTSDYSLLASKLGIANHEDLLSLPIGEALVRIGDSPPFKVRILDFKEYLKRPGSLGAN